jgi:putative protease
MNLVFALNNLDQIKEADFKEIIIGIKEWSRVGRFSINQLPEIINISQQKNCKLIIEWDILMTEDELEKIKLEVKPFLSQANCVWRVQDVGALKWLYDQPEPFLIQPVLETGHHNFLALEAHLTLLKNKLDRFILSSEIPFSILSSWLLKLKVPIEILVFGRIQLFYSPRKLLSPLKIEQVHDEWLEASGESEESPHKGFPVVQNRHGTFMYHIKDLSLLTEKEFFIAYPNLYYRVDLRHTQHELHYFRKIRSYFETFEEETLSAIENNYSIDCTRGFSRVNKTDVLFPKLKNHRLARQDEDYVGEVIDVIKDLGIVVQVRDVDLKKGSSLKLVTPLGKEKTFHLESLKNTDLKEVEFIERDHLALLPFISGISPQTIVRFN